MNGKQNNATAIEKLLNIICPLTFLLTVRNFQKKLDLSSVTNQAKTNRL